MSKPESVENYTVEQGRDRWILEALIEMRGLTS